MREGGKRLSRAVAVVRGRRGRLGRRYGKERREREAREEGGMEGAYRGRQGCLLLVQGIYQEHGCTWSLLPHVRLRGNNFLHERPELFEIYRI
jgi:hypothetical protein